MPAEARSGRTGPLDGGGRENLPPTRKRRKSGTEKAYSDLKQGRYNPAFSFDYP